MIADDPFPPELRSLCPRVCGACGESLADRPLGQSCPKCGQAESTQTLVLRGWNTDYPRLKTFGNWVRFFGPLAFILFVLAENALLSWQMAAIVGAIVLPILLARYSILLRDRLVPPVRLYASPLGVCTGVHRKRPTLQRWQREWRVDVSGPAVGGRCWLKIERNPLQALTGTMPMMQIDFDASEPQLEALRHQLQAWIANENAGHGFEVLPYATAVIPNPIYDARPDDNI